MAGLSPSDPISASYQNPFPGMPTGKSHRDGLAMDWSQGHNDAIVNGIGRIGHMKGGSAAIWKDDMMAKDFTHQAVEFIRREKDRPFFLLFATHDNHVPRVPHKDFTGKTTMGARGDAIDQFDWSVGQILEALDVLKIFDNTLVILSSDNGPVLDDGYKDGAAEKVGDHKPDGPFRGGKYSLFEGGTRSPFITHWPARITPGVSDALISQVDLLASLASLTKQSVPTADAPDSQNQLDALLGDSTTGRDSLLLHAGGIAIRQGDWKYIPAGRTPDKLGPWTEIQIPEPGLLFNLSTDPGETNNLAATHPDLLQQMQITLERARRTPH